MVSSLLVFDPADVPVVSGPFNVREEVKNFLVENQILFTETKEYLQLDNKPVRLYPLSTAWDYRTPFFDDKGGVPKEFFRQTSIENEKNGIRTIWIKPWEFELGSTKRDVLKSIILSASGKVAYRFYGRQTVVREVPTSELRPFLTENSFYGWRGSSIALGLYSTVAKNGLEPGTLLMVYTFGYPFFGGKNKKYDLEVIRASTLKGCQVLGGATKLFKHFINNYPTVWVGGNEVEWNTICYYVDFDHNSGNSLPHLGFSFQGYVGPGFMNVNVDTGKATHRDPARHKEIMELIKQGKMYSIFNAGVKVYTYTRGSEIQENSNFVNE